MDPNSDGGKLLTTLKSSGFFDAVLLPWEYQVEEYGFGRRVTKFFLPPKDLLSFFCLAQDVFGEEYGPGLKYLRNKAGFYTREEIATVFLDFLALIRSEAEGTDSFCAFVFSHPWTLRYARTGHPEADRFHCLVREDGGTMSIGTVAAPFAQMRERVGLPHRLVVTVAAESRELTGRIVEVAFDEVSNGYYTPVER